MNEEARQMRAHKLAVGASSSRIVDVERSTTVGVVIAADTTDDVFTPEGAVRGKWTRQKVNHHLPPYFIFLMKWGQLHSFLLGWGKWKVSSRVKSE